MVVIKEAHTLMSHHHQGCQVFVDRHTRHSVNGKAVPTPAILQTHYTTVFLACSLLMQAAQIYAYSYTCSISGEHVVSSISSIITVLDYNGDKGFICAVSQGVFFAQA